MSNEDKSIHEFDFNLPIKNRIFISVPLFAVGFLLTRINFDIIWRYFAWSNQTLAMVVARTEY